MIRCYVVKLITTYKVKNKVSPAARNGIQRFAAAADIASNKPSPTFRISVPEAVKFIFGFIEILRFKERVSVRSLRKNDE